MRRVFSGAAGGRIVVDCEAAQPLGEGRVCREPRLVDRRAPLLRIACQILFRSITPDLLLRRLKQHRAIVVRNKRLCQLARVPRLRNAQRPLPIIGAAARLDRAEVAPRRIWRILQHLAARWPHHRVQLVAPGGLQPSCAVVPPLVLTGLRNKLSAVHSDRLASLLIGDELHLRGQRRAYRVVLGVHRRLRHLLLILK